MAMDWSFLIKNKKALSVTTDTRTLNAGDVFFALRGENFDGNTFVADALKKGVSLVVMDDKAQYEQLGSEQKSKCVVVENSLLALQDLANQWRKMLSIKVLAITGTNGKTTTKELITTVLKTKYKVCATQGNLNNEIGVPLTLLKMTAEDDIAIVEMGASHPGDIKELAEIAEPDCGLITNVGIAHIAGFGSFEGVMQTKKELYDYLKKHDGFVFRNADNQYLTTMAGDLKSITYRTGEMLENTHLIGSYNAENVSAAICVGEYFGVEKAAAIEAIRGYIPHNNRSMLLQTQHNTVIMDAYNANPSSMMVALNDFDGDTYILGSMQELGTYSQTAHQNLVNSLNERRADNVFLVGEEFEQTTATYPIFRTVEELEDFLQKNPLKNRKILVKGSRKNKLENIINNL